MSNINVSPHIQARVPTISAVLRDGTILEMLYSKDDRTSALAQAKDGVVEIVPTHRVRGGPDLAPLASQNTLLVHEVVLLPSVPEDYGTKADLVARVHAFIHRFVELPPVYETIAAHYVLLTWLYDCFSELPYLRVLGEPGSGKTRFLLVVGSLCNKPIFASGASTVSPVFRMLDAVRGTLVFDEADFRFTDERSEIIKILNNGTCQGFPVLRSEQDGRTKEFSPRAYHVFGPKLIAARAPFDDPGLESRFISERMGAASLRADVPISLPASYREDALRLRNQLLLFRLKERSGVALDPQRIPASLEPRMAQMFGPLLAVIDDEKSREAVIAFAMTRQTELRLERVQQSDAQVLAAVRRVWTSAGTPPTVGDISAAYSQRYPEEGAAPRWIGHVLRRKLGLVTVRQRDGYVLAASEWSKVIDLAARLGIDPGG
jgi:hypothetical protein